MQDGLGEDSSSKFFPIYQLIIKFMRLSAHKENLFLAWNLKNSYNSSISPPQCVDALAPLGKGIHFAV